MKINVEEHVELIQRLWKTKFGDRSKYKYPANDYQIKRRGRLLQSKDLINDFVNETHEVIDLGSNTGILSIMCALNAKSVIGVELDTVCVQKALVAKYYFQQLGYDMSNLSFECCSVMDIVKSRRKFNFVLARQVIYHLSNEEVENIGDILDDECTIICSAKPEKKSSNNKYKLYQIKYLKRFLQKLNFDTFELIFKKSRWPTLIARRSKHDNN